ncbi:flagellar filament capping protein FliD [Dactylosporangium siamense]|uniref:Flagellar hook-associated protein 2 n=1 Tax=Dactylosporangium siamense TaxID=685454 RepID=A0A919PP55_9ACTN|nr:flagellar filament capping protein FliD [Dactylosporangium siamense]GIG45738.1 flagellar hook-associated protein 2 [Dactylosporangium siamense]
MGSVDGLISGMSTSSVISGLMQVEAAPQNALKTKITTQQKVVTAYQGINAKMKGLLDAAKVLTDPTAWKGGVATSSSDAATATTTASSATQSGSLTFRVNKLAASHSVVFGTPVDATTDTIMSDPSFVIDVNGVPKTVNVADPSLKGVVDAINKTPDLGVKATAFQVSPGKYTMQLTSTTTGALSKFEFPNGNTSPFTALGNVTPVSEGADAELAVGDSATPLLVTSSTNTFKDLMGGLTVTATKKQLETDPPVTVTVASDTEGIAAKVQAMVDAANTALSEIGTQTKNKSGAVAGGPLAGNSIMSSVSSSVLNTVSGGTSAGGSFKEIGIELTRSGTLTFDKAKFIAALNADPEKTQALFADTAQTDVTLKTGLADRMAAVADKSTQTNTGTLSRLITSGNDAITDLNHRVDDWDVRLQARQATLQKQFGAMETALGKLKNQGSWLSGQLASLG